MPPKEAPPKGPTIEEFEEGWKRKVTEWEYDEKRLIAAVESAESEKAFLAQKVAAASKEIERLKQQCAEVTRQSDERRVQLFHQEKAAHEMHERDQQLIQKQSADVEQLTAKISLQKQEVKQRAAAVEQASAAHQHHIALVQKRTSLTSMLKERLVKLRSEHVQVEARLLTALDAHHKRAAKHSSSSVGGAGEPKRLRASCDSLALFVGHRTATSEFAAQRLRDAFGFDVRHIVLPSPLHLDNSSGAPPAATPLIDPHPAAFVLGSGGPQVSYVHIGERNEEEDEQQQGEEQATRFLDRLSTAVLEASVGQHKEQRSIVSITGYAVPGSRGGSADSILFPVAAMQLVAKASCLSAAAAHGVGESAVTVVVSLRDVVEVLCGALCTQRNMLVMIEVFDGERGEHQVVLFTPDSSRPIVIRAALSTGSILLGHEGALGMSALASLLSKECSWDALPADRLVTRIQMELAALASDMQLELSSPPLPHWCQDWPQNAPLASPGCSRPASRVVCDKRPEIVQAPPAHILPSAAVPPLLSAKAKFCSVRFFVPSTFGGKEVEAAAKKYFGHVVSIAPAAGSATSHSDTNATHADFLVANVGASVAVSALFSSLGQQHRLAHAGLDPSGPNIRVSCALSGTHDVNIVRIALNRSSSEKLQEATRCHATLHGSDRLEWEKSHTPYNVISTAIGALSDSLPDGAVFAQVTAFDAVLSCDNAASLMAVVRKSQLVYLDTLQKFINTSATPSSSDSHEVTEGVPLLWPVFSLMNSYVPLRDVDVGGSYHKLALSKLGPHAFQQQTIMCLVVTDGDKSVPAHEQHAAIHAAFVYLSEKIPVAKSAVYAHVDLTTGLACSKAELAAMNKEGGGDTSGTALEEKRMCWRKLMQFLPPGAVDFLIRVTYPCMVITSPCFEQGERSLLVVPRTLQTLCPVTRKCIFSAATIISATTYFAQELLWQLPQRSKEPHADEAQPTTMSSWFMI